MKYASIFFSIILVFSFTCCNRDYTPKPRGFMRIDFPEKAYTLLEYDYPYSFEYPTYTKIIPRPSHNSEPYWIDIDLMNFNGRIHISYKKIDNNLAEYLEDSRTFAYKHIIKASAIKEKLIYNTEKKTYGMLYEIKGNTASSLQFYLTDSVKNFIRGSLYFNTQPNIDSLRPVITFFKEDIEHIINTFEWKN